MDRYTQPIIKGVKYTKMLPEGYSLVLEGGGTRGFYSSGVFEAFMEAGIMFPYIAGVSAGAANVLSYVSGQRGRSRVIVEKYVGDSKYLGYRNLIKHGSLFGYDFIFNTIPNEHIFWDREVFADNDIKLLTGATDCNTGQTVWFEKQQVLSGLDVLRASCSIPLLSKIVVYNDYQLLDGGISAPIPIEKSIADGNSFHVIVLTRNKGYLKPPFKHRNILKLFYSKYPELIKAILNRHAVYNRQLAVCEKLEAEGKAIIIRPQKTLEVDRINRDIEKLLYLYDEGREEAELAVAKLCRLLSI